MTKKLCGLLTQRQGPSLLKTLGGTNFYCLRFDDVIVFIQPLLDLFVKLAM